MTQPREATRTPGSEGRRAVASRVIDLRGELGLTQEGLAAKAGVSHRTIQNLEAGETWPQPVTLAAIARALEITAQDLRELAAAAPVQATP